MGEFGTFSSKTLAPLPAHPTGQAFFLAVEIGLPGGFGARLIEMGIAIGEAPLRRQTSTG